MKHYAYEIERIPLTGLPNTRDLGGMPTADGRTIRSGKLLRSGDLHELTEADGQMLREKYFLKKVIDFRTSEECRERPDQPVDGVAYLHLPILDEQALGITREKESDQNVINSVLMGVLKSGSDPGKAAEDYMKRMYASFLQSTFARQQYRRFFMELLTGSDGSILWHCTAGKDRAGLGTMLLLYALGVDRELILMDYMKVNEYSGPVVERQSRLAVESTGQKAAGEVVRKLFSVEPSYLEAVYEEIDRDFGSMDDFLRNEMGLDAEKRRILQDLYLNE
ncbi:MAG: tyrosine-protein phosphatase [Eubacteriales bacterium]|nr:tyrosine-protein phosphatase [Eubacteriales bacterium]